MPSVTGSKHSWKPTHAPSMRPCSLQALHPQACQRQQPNFQVPILSLRDHSCILPPNPFLTEERTPSQIQKTQVKQKNKNPPFNLWKGLSRHPLVQRLTSIWQQQLLHLEIQKWIVGNQPQDERRSSDGNTCRNKKGKPLVFLQVY